MLHAANLAPTEREVITSGDNERRAFSIANTGSAFKILIDGLYSDKIRAVIRELWSNAYDSHISAGCATLPFDCQLPTVFEPTFRVRDYGVSLSHEDVMGLYTTVFASSKSKTANMVGKFGLGSKSPFAYVDSFTVTTWLNNTKRMYSAYIGSDDVPMISLMGVEEDCEEPHGLEVAFPVKSKDCDAFCKAAEKVALGFKTHPNMTCRQCSFVKLTVQMEDEGLWQLCAADDGYFNSNTAYARQGCVVYPLDAGAIPNITDEQAAVLRSPFFIEFAMRDLDITPSREALGYTDKTCGNILAAADIIIEVVRARYTEQIAACPTYWEACIAFQELQNGDLHYSLKEMLTKGMLWHGRELVTQINMSGFLNHTSVKMGNVYITHYTPSSARRRRQLKWESSSYITVQPGVDAVYLDNTQVRTSQAQARIRWHFECRKAQTAAPQAIVWIKGDPKSRAFQRVYAAMGRPPMIDVATLEKPPVEKGYTKKPVRLKVLNSRRKFEVMDVDEDENIVYVDLERGDIMSNVTNRVTSGEQVQRTADLLVKHGYISDARIVGVPRSCKSAPKRNSHWRRLWDVAEKAVAENFNASKAAKAQHCSDILREHEFSVAEAFLKHNCRPKYRTSPMGKLLTLYTRIKERAESWSDQRDWLSLAQQLTPSGVQLPAYKVAYEPLAETVQARYQMLELVGSYFNSTNIWTVLAYVNLVDSHPSHMSSLPLPE